MVERQVGESGLNSKEGSSRHKATTGLAGGRSQPSHGLASCLAKSLLKI